MQSEIIKKMWIELFISPSINTIFLMQTGLAETGAKKGKQHRKGDMEKEREEIIMLEKPNIWRSRKEAKKGGENKMCQFKR